MESETVTTDAVAVLANLGIDVETAERLVARNGSAKCVAVAKSPEVEKADNPAGFARKVLEKGWRLTSVMRAERQREERALGKIAREHEALVRRQSAEAGREIVSETRRLAEMVAAMPAMEVDRLHRVWCESADTPDERTFRRGLPITHASVIAGIAALK
jgi:hypothetical protein